MMIPELIPLAQTSGAKNPSFVQISAPKLTKWTVFDPSILPGILPAVSSTTSSGYFENKSSPQIIPNESKNTTEDNSLILRGFEVLVERKLRNVLALIGSADEYVETNIEEFESIFRSYSSLHHRFFVVLSELIKNASFSENSLVALIKAIGNFASRFESENSLLLLESILESKVSLIIREAALLALAAVGASSSVPKLRRIAEIERSAEFRGDIEQVIDYILRYE